MGRAYKDDYLDLFKDLAREKGLYIVGGSLFYFDDEDGRYYNASFLFDPDGGVREQRKTHRAYELVYNREMVTAGVHQRGDVSPHRDLDVERVRSGCRRCHVG